MGGGIAAALAITRPDVWRGVILSAPMTGGVFPAPGPVLRALGWGVLNVALAAIRARRWLQGGPKGGKRLCASSPANDLVRNADAFCGMGVTAHLLLELWRGAEGVRQSATDGAVRGFALLVMHGTASVVRRWKSVLLSSFDSQYV